MRDGKIKMLNYLEKLGWQVADYSTIIKHTSRNHMSLDILYNPQINFQIKFQMFYIVLNLWYPNLLLSWNNFKSCTS